MIGEALDGKYRIDRQLGAGGMGNVYLATHLGTTRIVAVKVIAPRWAAEPQFLARFQREAQACGRLRHVNIVNVTDFGIAETAKGQVPYLVMELLDGETLADFQRKQPRPPLTMVVDLLDQIALALDEAHRHDIVHRDLKPENIWLEPNGRGGYTVKVLDFGVAKMKLAGEGQATAGVELRGPVPVIGAAAMAGESETVAISLAADEAETVAMPRERSGSTPSSGAVGSDSWGSDGGRTMPGSLVGTPSYMSPEQALGREIDYRSDIYSLAVVAYSLVCGELPFRGQTNELMEFHRSGTPQPPASVTAMPRDVSDAVMAGLARDPAERPGSAGQFARRFHNSVDAEFFALRRSKAFLMRNLGAFALLMLPFYTALLSAIGLAGHFASKLLPETVLRMAVAPVAAAALLIFCDNALRATAALIALDERVRVRRFKAFRVLRRLVKATPALVATQVKSMFWFGPGWLTGDCLSPVVCVVENLKGKAAVARSRNLMTGLGSAGRALAVRHVALAVLAVGDLVAAVSLRNNGHSKGGNDAVWFPIFALYAAAPLFLYDRTAAREDGPLLQLDRTPEVRVTSRPFSLSSMVWMAIVAIYLLYQPVKLWVFGGK